jgi:hypothetical protein
MAEQFSEQSALLLFDHAFQGKFSASRYALAVRPVWLALSSDLLSPAFQPELSLQ